MKLKTIFAVAVFALASFAAQAAPGGMTFAVNDEGHALSTSHPASVPPVTNYPLNCTATNLAVSATFANLTCAPVADLVDFDADLPVFDANIASVAAELSGEKPRSFMFAEVVQTGSGHQVNLSWTQGTVPAGATCPAGSGSTAVTSNSVYRATTSGGEAKPALSVSAAAEVAYTDSAVTAGSTYYYKVTASNCTGESAMSSEVAATIPNPLAPNPPTGFTGVAQ